MLGPAALPWQRPVDSTRKVAEVAVDNTVRAVGSRGAPRALQAPGPQAAASTVTGLDNEVGLFGVYTGTCVAAAWCEVAALQVCCCFCCVKLLVPCAVLRGLGLIATGDVACDEQGHVVEEFLLGDGAGDAVVESAVQQPLNRRARRAAIRAARPIRESLMEQRGGLRDLREDALLQLGKNLAGFNRAHHRLLAQLDRQLADCDGQLELLDDFLAERGASRPAPCRSGRLAVVRATVSEAAKMQAEVSV